MFKLHAVLVLGRGLVAESHRCLMTARLNCHYLTSKQGQGVACKEGRRKFGHRESVPSSKATTPQCLSFPSFELQFNCQSTWWLNYTSLPPFPALKFHYRTSMMGPNSIIYLESLLICGTGQPPPEKSLQKGNEIYKGYIWEKASSMQIFYNFQNNLLYKI